MTSNPKAVQTESVIVFSKPDCPFCKKAKALLTEKGLRYEEVTVGEAINSTGLRAVSNADTVPQIFISGKLIGGSDDLAAYFS